MATAIADHLEGHAQRHSVLRTGTGNVAAIAAASDRLQGVAATLRSSGIRGLAPILLRGDLRPGHLCLALAPEALATALGGTAEDLDPALLDLETPLTCRRRGVEMKIVAGARRPTPDRAMLRALQNAHRWAGQLRSGMGVREIARQDAVSESYAARIIPLALLSPKIQSAVVAGSQPLELTLETLVRTRLPLDWEGQERCFGLTL